MPQKNFHTDAFTRGGQIFSHQWRMRLQNFKLVVSLSFILALLVLSIAVYLSQIDLWIWNDFWLQTYLWGHFKVMIWPLFKKGLLTLMEGFSFIIPQAKIFEIARIETHHLMTTYFHPYNGNIIMPTVQFLKHPWVTYHASLIHKILMYTFGSWILGMSGVVYLFYKKSRTLEQKQILKGNRMISAREAKVSLKGKSSDLSLAGCPLPKGSETEHFLLTGTTGVGKTNCLHELLPQIRESNNKAIIVDLRGNLTPHYYRPGQDILLNPFDKRSENWHVWAECRHAYEFDEMAEILLPSSTHGGGDHEWWNKAGRAMFSVGAKKLYDEGRFSIRALKDYLIALPLKDILPFFEGTDIASFAEKDASKTTASIRSVLTPLMRKIAYLPDQAQAFSIREWIAREDDKSWLFLTAGPNQKRALLPLLSAWIGWAMNSLKTLPEVHHPRLWFICDELPQLQYLPTLEEGLSEIRGFGGCFVAGIQDIHQLKKVYGPQEAHTLLSLFNTKVIFNCGNIETASYMASFFGEHEFKEHSEGLSFGANSVRDGVNLSQHKKIEPLVKSHDLLMLPKLQAYLKRPGGHSSVHLYFNYNKAAATQPRFIPAENYADPLEEEDNENSSLFYSEKKEKIFA